MSQMTDDTIRLSKLEEPPHCVLIITKPRVEMLADRLKKKMLIEPVIVARLGAKYYPVGNLDCLRAYKERGMDKVKCIVQPVNSKEEILEMHVKTVTDLTYHPLAISDAINTLISKGVKKASLPSEMQMLHGIDISDEARSILEEFIMEISRTHLYVPSMTHILKPMTKVTKSKQSEAMKVVVKYSSSSKGVIPPDRYAIKKILNQFGTYAGPDAVTVKPIKKEAEPGDSGDVEVTVQSNDHDVPTQMDPANSMMQYTCACKRRLLVNLKNATVKELRERNSHIEAVETADGQAVYITPKRDTEFLGLASQPKIYKYFLDESEGATVITTKRTITKKTLLGISKLLDNQGRR